MIKGTVMYWDKFPDDTPFVKIMDADGKFVGRNAMELDLVTGRAVIMRKNSKGEFYLVNDEIATEIVFLKIPLEVRFQDPQTPWQREGRVEGE